MKRGTLRIYLGYAAGVGKTYAMLGEGHRRAERGADVVVGFVETHGRPKTQQQIGDLEVIPRRRIEHLGGTFEEMDLDALLQRRPEIALVDELAHTDVPGSRNEKRWEDVELLLDAGISVISTLNVQHLESFNDVVQRITGVRQRETIPDAVVRRADQIELVDMSPWALRRRMSHGNIYPAEKIDAAMSNYFREGNLSALRELALRWVADKVDDDLLDYLDLHEIAGAWETRERILVGLSGRPTDESLIRRASRMASRRSGDLLAVHVVAGDATGTGSDLSNQRSLVDQLGGELHEVLADDVAGGLLEFARAEHVTQLVLGASSTSTSHRPWRRTVLDRVLHRSGEIDVHVISLNDESAVGQGRRAGAPTLRSISWTGLPWWRVGAGAAIGAGLIALLTTLLISQATRIEIPTLTLLYLVAVVITAAIGGWIPAVAAAVISSLIINWYFTPPLYTWTIADPEHVVALVAFLVVAIVVSAFVDLAARRSAQAQRARAEAEALARLSGAMLSDDDPMPVVVEELRHLLGMRGAAILAPEGDRWRTVASSGTKIPDPALASERATLSDGAVLALAGGRLPAEGRTILAIFVAQLELAVRDRERRSQIEGVDQLTEVNELRAAILAAVSHDLRTPLSSLKTAVSSLRDPEVAWTNEQTATFLATIEEEADRLNVLVGNLLDMSRIQAHALTLVWRKVGLDEIVPRALAWMPRDHTRLELHVPETLPRIEADPALLERAIANVVANAARFSPPSTPVLITASQVQDRVELRVIDRGPGIAPDSRAQVFEPFQRLGDRGTGGTGLGLAVARGFVEAMGGEIEIQDTPGGGLTMVLAFEVAA